MRIVLVIPSLKQGGAERVISELGNYFASSGQTVHIILLAEAVDFYSTDPKIEIHRLGFKQEGLLSRIYNETKLFFRFRKLVGCIQPDIILSFGDKYNVFTLLATMLMRLKVFVSDRSNPRKKIPRLTAFLRAVTYKHAAGIIAQTSLAKELLHKATGNTNIQVIANPIRKVIVDNTVVKEKIIINVGRLVPEKGQKYLLQSFAAITPVGWKLVILGDGPLMNDLRQEAVRLGISEDVIMPGSVNNVDAWLSKAKIFAFTSVSEGFPNALIEAMAAGLPCVSFDCDAGPRDIIEHDFNGILIQSMDTDQLTTALNAFIDDAKLRKRISANAQHISEKLNMSLIGQEYLNFFEKTSHP